jgi:act minimal PKS chain-length factor (CLF/KS beta)
MTVTTSTRAPVITGIGVTAPTGLGVDAHWSATLAGKSAIGRIARFDPSGYPVQLAGEVPGFDAKTAVRPDRLISQTDHWTHLAFAAADEALQDAGVDPSGLPEYEMAVVTSSSSGGTEFGQREMTGLYQHDPSWVGAYQSIAWFYAATTGQLSIRHGMRGPCGVLSCEQAGGLDAIAQARRLIGRGARLVLTGGTDASLCPYGLTAQLSTGKLSTATRAAMCPARAGRSWSWKAPKQPRPAVPGRATDGCWAMPPVSTRRPAHSGPVSCDGSPNRRCAQPR